MPPASIVFPLLIIGMIGIRKLLNRLFSRNELKWLDDIIPESQRKEDASRRTHLQLQGDEDAIEVTRGTVNFELPDGRVVKIPLGTIHYDRETRQVRIKR